MFLLNFSTSRIPGPVGFLQKSVKLCKKSRLSHENKNPKKHKPFLVGALNPSEKILVKLEIGVKIKHI